jgi:2-oxoadipate dioxygenase/decarboxylase-like protein
MAMSLTHAELQKNRVHTANFWAIFQLEALLSPLLMHSTHLPSADSFFEKLLGARSWQLLEAAVATPAELDFDQHGRLGRAELAMALGFVLLDDLCDRVPFARAYVQEAAKHGQKIVFDHGAMRTVRLEIAGIPSGRRAVARLLEPLGYAEIKRYPLPRLGMVGFVYTHKEFPEELPQYFVSELYPDLFSSRFQASVRDLLTSSTDPLPSWAEHSLAAVDSHGNLAANEAVQLIHAIAACFGRFHRDVTVEEYETFRAESPEMAWISTEGHAFNHITDRVADVAAVAATQLELGRPVKGKVEVSASGRVIQTALHATEVERLMLDGEAYISRRVPGSFLEFISREHLPGGGLDLAFDAQNAQGIFKMTDETAA